MDLIENVDITEEKGRKSFEFLADDKTIENVELGETWKRCVAYIVDLIIINLIIFFIVIMLMFIIDPSIEKYDGGLTTLAIFAYFIYFESSPKQATIGKRWMKLIVMDLDGKRISKMRAFLRYFSRTLIPLVLIILDIIVNKGNLLDEHMIWFLLTPLLTYIPILFTDLRRGIHDMAAGTVVVRGIVESTG